MNAKKKPAPPPPKKGGRKTSSKNGEKNRPKPKTGFKVTEPVFTPPKIAVVAVEGWGKTSLAAHIPDVALLMPETETGYKTLLGIGRVPKVPNMITTSWKETMDALDNVGDAKALALDELSGFEAQCFENVCRKEYSMDWNKFNSYGRGYKIAAPEWRKFLAKLESLDIMIVAMSHCAIETFKDPLNDDHDRYVAALHKGTWGATRRWADACLFGTFESIVDDEGKGIGGTDRVLLTEHRDTHDAKNRYGMAADIEMPDDYTEMWPHLWKELTEPSGEAEPEEEPEEE